MPGIRTAELCSRLCAKVKSFNSHHGETNYEYLKFSLYERSSLESLMDFKNPTESNFNPVRGLPAFLLPAAADCTMPPCLTLCSGCGPRRMGREEGETQGRHPASRTTRHRGAQLPGAGPSASVPGRPCRPGPELRKRAFSQPLGTLCSACKVPAVKRLEFWQRERTPSRPCGHCGHSESTGRL